MLRYIVSIFLGHPVFDGITQFIISFPGHYLFTHNELRVSVLSPGFPVKSSSTKMLYGKKTHESFNHKEVLNIFASETLLGFIVFICLFGILMNMNNGSTHMFRFLKILISILKGFLCIPIDPRGLVKVFFS